jgi:rod shape determining protein RodA
MTMALIQRIRSIFGDPILLLAVVTLSLFGVAMIYSAGQLDVPDAGVASIWRMQLLWLGLSLVALFVVMRVQVRWLEWIALPIYVVGILTLVATLVFGTGAGTAASTKSWLRFGSVAVQPAQFANVATILMLGRVMGAWRDAPQTLAALWKPIAIVALPLLLVMAQPDLGTAMVFGGVLLATLYWGGTPVGLLFLLVSPILGLFLAFWSWVFSVYMVLLILFVIIYRTYLWESVAVLGANLAAGAVALPVWNSLEPYQKNRFTAFLDPYSDPRGAGYHHIQSRVAIGSGGVLGQGYLEGSQKRLAFLPEQHTDFIYAVIGEEFGFLGAGLVLLMYALILWRLIRLAEGLSDPFAGVVVFGIFGAWFTHILVNIGMTVGVMPITGIPLPFLSYGGSFLLATYLALGIAQRVALEQGRI